MAAGKTRKISRSKKLVTRGPSCDKPAEIGGGTFRFPDGTLRASIFADLCCPEGEKILKKGFEKLDKAGKKHLSPFMKLIETSKAESTDGELMEHCVFAFGLNDDQLAAFTAAMTRK